MIDPTDDSQDIYEQIAVELVTDWGKALVNSLGESSPAGKYDVVVDLPTRERLDALYAKARAELLAVALIEFPS